MKRDLTSLNRTHYDVVVIGGGITGACLAHDMALRGRKVALVEQDDFGGFTSASSSRLLHGGIRYLPMAQFHKVRESARERTIFQYLAPHLTRWVPFVIPTMGDDPMKGRVALNAGMFVYELLCSGLNDIVGDTAKKVPASRFLSRSQVHAQVPQLSHLRHVTGAWLLYESHMRSSERMTLSFVKTAVENDADIANYVQVTDLLCHGRRVDGVLVRNCLGGETFDIRARVTANAAGPFIPVLNRRFGNLRLRKPATGLAKGVHMITRQIHPTHALALPTEKKTEGYVTRGGRHVFVIPWKDCSLVGTTNIPFHGPPEQVRVLTGDIVDFLRDINRALPNANLTERDVRFAFSGLYTLTANSIKADTYQGTGDYQVVDHADRDGVEGIVTVLGAKYTTARKVAQIAGDRIERILGGNALCRTDRMQLVEGRISDLTRFKRDRKSAYSHLLPPQRIDDLIATYGSGLDAFVRYAAGRPSALEPLSGSATVLCGQVAYAVEHEMACTLADVVFRRTDLGMFGSPDSKALERAAAIMDELLGWGPERTRDEIAQVTFRYNYLE